MTRDLILGLVMLAVAAAYYAAAAAMPETMLADAVGPHGVPTAYAVVLGALSLVLIVQSLANRRTARAAGPPPPAEPADAAGSVSAEGAVPVARVAGMLLIGVIYVAVVPWLGYVVSLAGVLLATTYYLGGGLNRQTIIVAAAGALFFWLLFVWVLRIPQPAGVWPSSL